MQARDIISAKTLIALGADVNKINHFNMAALDIVDFMLARDPAHPAIAQMIKDVGGVSGRNAPIPQEPATHQQMDTGEQTMSKTGRSLSFSLSPSHYRIIDSVCVCVYNRPAIKVFIGKLPATG